MASRKTLNAANLIALGAERLAYILIALSGENRDVKRRLRLELAETAGGDDLASEVGKRLTAIKNATSFVDWQKRKELEKDLNLQRQMIAERVAKTRPDLALDLMWRFMALMEPVVHRVDDSNGVVGDIFRFAVQDLGEIAEKARPNPVQLGDQVFNAVTRNDYGEFDRLIPAIAPALGREGCGHLKARLSDALGKCSDKSGKHGCRASSISRSL